MVDRRKSDRQPVTCVPQNPVCMTIGFMLGMIVGSLFHTENSVISTITSVVVSTIVFHFTFVRNVNFLGLFKTVTKKGS